MFKVEIIGNIGADAEIREANGSKFVSFRVAHSDKWTTKAGESKESTIWVDVTMNNHESKVVQFLKAGTKVFVRGNGSLRVYSSPKDKCMKAGLQISALEVELCGGQTDSVPRSLIDPDTAQILDVTKHYWCNLNCEGMREGEVKMLLDDKGHEYRCNNRGFVAPVIADSEAQGKGNQSNSKADSEAKRDDNQSENKSALVMSKTDSKGKTK